MCWLCDRAIVLQAKSKKLTLEARKGNDNQIKDDLKRSVQASYDQGYTCATLIGNPRMKFVDGEAKNSNSRRNSRRLTSYVSCQTTNYPEFLGSAVS
jgi:hypothetical protein